MSSIYGDNIFESKELVIDRLFESINNDIILYDGLLNESVINESVKDSIKAFIHKIKEFIQMVIKWIASIPAKIKAIFNKKENSIIETKIKETTNNINNIKSKDIETKRIDFNKTINYFTKVFNNHMNMEKNDAGEARSGLYFIENGNKLNEDIKIYNELLRKFESSLPNKLELSKIIADYEVQKDQLNGIYNNKKSVLKQEEGWESSINGKLSYYRSKHVVVGTSFLTNDIVIRNISELKNFGDILLKYYTMSNKSLDIVLDYSGKCRDYYNRCNKCIDEVENYINKYKSEENNTSINTISKNDYSSLSTILKNISSSINETKKDLSTFLTYFSEEGKLLKKISAYYYKEFGPNGAKDILEDDEFK